MSTESEKGIRQINHKERLRIRYEKSGLDGFHSYEVLELILSYSLVRCDTKRLAKDLIQKFGSLTNVLNASVEEICQSVKGISKRTAVLIKLFKDTASYHLGENIINRDFVKSPQQVYDYYKLRFKGVRDEEFWIIYLNSSNLILKDERLFKGSNNESRVYIKKLIERVISTNAVSVVIVHNHPGGRLEPSREDVAITRKICSALGLVEVKLLDHLIIGVNDFFSFANSGML